MSVPMLAGHGRLVIALLAALGVFVLMAGLPRANRYRLPWRWRFGILHIGLGLIFWPAFYYFLGHLDLEMLWFPIWLATFLTFAVGVKRLLASDKFEPSGSYRDPYDLGWVLRPRPEKPSSQDVLETMLEDQANPLAAIVRPLRPPQKADSEDKPKGDQDV